MIDFCTLNSFPFSQLVPRNPTALGAASGYTSSFTSPCLPPKQDMDHERLLALCRGKGEGSEREKEAFSWVLCEDIGASPAKSSLHQTLSSPCNTRLSPPECVKG